MKRIAPVIPVVVLLCAVVAATFAVAADLPSPPLVVRGDFNYPPYEYLDHGKPSGFNVDMMQAIAREKNLTIKIDLGPWAEVRKQVEQGEIAALTGMFYSQKRAMDVLFTPPIVVVSHSLFVHKGSKISRIEDINDSPVLVQREDIMHDYVRKHLPIARVVAVETQRDAMLLLERGTYQAALLGTQPNLRLMRELGLTHVAIVGQPMEFRDYCIAVARNQPALHEAMADGLARVKSSGEYGRIYDKWFPPETPSTLGTVLRYVVWIAGPILVLLLMSLVWSWLLKKQVIRKTAQLSKEFDERVRAEEERKRLQEQLQQAMKMEAIGRLAGSVAHDFNNLLTSIKGNIALALMDLEDDHACRANLQEVDRAADRAAELTQRLLVFSRKKVIEPRVLHLHQLLAGTEKMLKRLIGEDISLRLATDASSDLVKVDPGQMEQVVVNLSVNARDAMPQGGNLVIETANVVLDQEYCRQHAGVAPGNYLMLAVSDTGCGMTAEVRAHLFEPFFTTKPQGKGTGLGLATIFGAVKQAGGSIAVYSEPNMGSTFKVYLPMADEAPTSQPEPHHVPAYLGGNETILLVEDEELVRHIAVRILTRQGYRVLEAADGAQALALAGDFGRQIDLLLTDVVMPGMNGRELATRIAQINGDIPVLYVSGYAENVIIHHGVVDKGLNFLSKPYTPRDLAEKVRQILSHQRLM